MHKVNPSFLSYMLSPLTGGADIDEEVTKYNNIIPNNEAEVKEIIEVVLKPFFESAPMEFRHEAKKSLSYYLTTDKIDFERTFNSNLMPFDHPTIAKQFFLWLWEVLFNDESYDIKNIETYIEINDINEPLRLISNMPSGWTPG